ncbi:hypothetical protein PSACC_02009 [Paramicrosporidium saccamoebae]|uniref:Uncharacterized protein n=1 Tax=Paramicrosporidium saccamoebae TaxID=1246581 RepID=A0A2H9TK99_9FUNG|nr:hypothetical protein PSACC_02009 [Paramicrosporidium saccamoebae]
MQFLTLVSIFLAVGACSIGARNHLLNQVNARIEVRRANNIRLFEEQYNAHQSLPDLESELSWEFIIHGADPVNVCGEFAGSAFFVGNIQTNLSIAVENNYLGTLRCLQTVWISEWNNDALAHYFLALSYYSEWYDEDLWMRNWLVANCKRYVRAIYAAGNQRLLGDVLSKKLPTRLADQGHLPGVHPRNFDLQAPNIFDDDAVGTVQFFLANGVTLARLEELACTYYQNLTRNGVSRILKLLLSSEVTPEFRSKFVELSGAEGPLDVFLLAYESWNMLPAHMDLA